MRDFKIYIKIQKINPTNSNRHISKRLMIQNKKKELLSKSLNTKKEHHPLQKEVNLAALTMPFR